MTNGWTHAYGLRLEHLFCVSVLYNMSGYCNAFARNVSILYYLFSFKNRIMFSYKFKYQVLDLKVLLSVIHRPLR